ncbi:hypothetical protein TSOC_009822 [Tetrabaena socialis]|uniref:Exostosin GT47 domain-containing protein n=1 Tax=Tetrabaena socialis TaxID=47790 RepID=A0A2J7ZUU8_9CHLO|nr:hypothetical protein TSOC_009822 [Tetrabaena socialis]|eukprot:PNH04053.1 hypothetical protein TSOC_009822 [Tetrabaena socialis]
MHTQRSLHPEHNHSRAPAAASGMDLPPAQLLLEPWHPLPTVHDSPAGPPLRNATLVELRAWQRYVSGTSPFFCLPDCCWRYEPAAWPYRGLRPANVTRADLVSPTTARQLGDAVYGSRLKRPEGEKLRPLRPELLSCVQGGSVVDHLQSDKVLHWLAMNCDMRAELTPKLSCLPLGVSQWSYRDNPAQPFLGVLERMLARGEGLQQGVLPSRHHPKAKLLLVSFSLRSNPRVRHALWGHACKGPLREMSTCAPSLGLEETYEAAALHAFVLAPEGKGADTYRVWEVLYLGSYPVVLRNELASQYPGMPVLVVDSAEELTAELLWRTYGAFRLRDWNYERLYLGFYHELLGGFRAGISKEYRISYRQRGKLTALAQGASARSPPFEELFGGCVASSTMYDTVLAAPAKRWSSAVLIPSRRKDVSHSGQAGAASQALSWGLQARQLRRPLQRRQHLHQLLVPMKLRDAQQQRQRPGGSGRLATDPSSTSSCTCAGQSVNAWSRNTTRLRGASSREAAKAGGVGDGEAAAAAPELLPPGACNQAWAVVLSCRLYCLHNCQPFAWETELGDISIATRH